MSYPRLGQEEEKARAYAVTARHDPAVRALVSAQARSLQRGAKKFPLV